MSKIQDLKSQINSTTDPAELVALYEQLIPMLNEPKVSYKNMNDTERAAFRAERRARRAAGLTRSGKPMTEEQKAKLAARWTPERRAEASAKAKGRKASPETLERVRAAAALRKDKQAAMVKRLAELEALVAGAPAEDDSTPNKGGRRK